MNIYTLLYYENSDSRCGADVRVFPSLDEARACMRTGYEKSLKILKFDRDIQTDEHHCEISDNFASAVDGMDSYRWEIEEHELDVRVAVKVEGGMIQEAIANADVNLDVYDLDVPVFPDGDEEAEGDSVEAEYDRLSETPGWINIWA